MRRLLFALLAWPVLASAQPEIHCKHFFHGYPTGTPASNDLIIRDIYALSNNEIKTHIQQLILDMFTALADGNVDRLLSYYGPSYSAYARHAGDDTTWYEDFYLPDPDAMRTKAKEIITEGIHLPSGEITFEHITINGDQATVVMWHTRADERVKSVRMLRRFGEDWKITAAIHERYPLAA